MSDKDKMMQTPPLPNPGNKEEMGVGVEPPKTIFADDDFSNEAHVLAESPVENTLSEEKPPTEVTPPKEEVATSPDLDIADSPSASNELAPRKFYDLKSKRLTFNKSRPIFIPYDKGQVVNNAMSLSPTTEEDRNAFIDVTESAGPGDEEWILSTWSAEQTGYTSDVLIDASVRDLSNWSNMIERNGLPMLGDRRDKLKSFSEQGVSITGSDAVEMFIAGTNLGRPVVIPLWHSGIWLKLRAPSAAYLAEIDRALAFSREELGLDVFGAIGSNDRLIFDEILVDAALKLVKESSISFARTPLELKEYISSFDIDSLIWGMAQAAYPDGADIGIPCPSCRNVSNVRANLLRMRWVDESRLTEKQIKFMARGFGQRTTPVELKEYRDEFEILNTEGWEYNGRKFTYRIPSIEEYLLSGRSYLSAIGRALTETLREDYTDDNKRAQAMRSMLEAEEACRFTHYVKEIRINSADKSQEGYAVVSDNETITQILRQMSGDYAGTVSFTESIRAYIVDAINTIIGFPNVKCPSCGMFHLNAAGEETLVVPFNAAVGFFTLAQHKISLAGSQTLTDLTMLGVKNLVSRALANGVPV